MTNINSLPVETLGRILSDDFTSVKDLDFPVKKNRHRAILKSTSKIAYQVCRRWRNIIRNNSASYCIGFTFNDREEKIEKTAITTLISRYQHWAESSPSADIDVIILLRRYNYPDGDTLVATRSKIVGQLIDFVVGFAHRWRLFTFEANQGSDHDLLNKALNVRAAQGGTLLARLITFKLIGDRYVQTPVDFLAKYGAPNLETFHSQNVATDREQVLKFTRAASTVDIVGSDVHKKFVNHLLDCFRHLVHLTLGPERVCYRRSMVLKLGTRDFGWHSLRGLTLEQQTLGSLNGSRTPWPRGFPNVVFIRMIGVSLNSVKLFFSSFTLPSLHTLILEYGRDAETDSTSGTWCKADDVFPKTIRLLRIEPQMLEFVIRYLARSTEDFVIDRVWGDTEPVDLDTTQVPLLNLRKLSLKGMPLKWVTWVVEKAQFRDLEIFIWQPDTWHADIVCDTNRPALLVVGQSRLEEIHLLNIHDDTGGALLSRLASPSVRRLNLRFAVSRCISQIWSQFCESNKEVLLQVIELSLANPGGVCTSTRSKTRDFSLAAFSNVVKLTLNLRGAKYIFLEHAFQLYQDPRKKAYGGAAMPHLQTLDLRLEMDSRWFHAILDLLRVREEQDMALFELIIVSFAPIGPSERQRLVDRVIFFSFRQVPSADDNLLWE